MFQILFKENYNYKLIKIMIMATFSGVFVANILAPLIGAYILQEYLDNYFLIAWLCLHIIVFILRVLNGKKILALIKNDSERTYFYLNISYFFSFVTAVLFGILVWIAVLSKVEDLIIFTLGMIIFGLAAGSIVTLGAVFTAYFIFVVTNCLILISALLYHGGEMFSIFAFATTIMLFTLVSAGYKQFIVIRNSISMDETFKKIYEGSSDGLIISENGRFVSCNEAILTMFKIPSMELFLRSDMTRFSPENQPDGDSSFKKMALLTRLAYKNGSSSFEWLHKDFYGEEFWCEIVLTRIHLKGKDLLYGVWRDISQRKAMSLATKEQQKEIESLNENLESRVEEEVRKNMQKDRQLLQQSRLAQMGEMISMIAHQWRQPLTAISSTSAAIGLKASLNKLDNESAVQLASKISTYVQHLSETIDDFRNFFKQNREKVQTNYNEIIESVLNIMEMSLRHKQINIIKELNSLDEFFAYPNELKQVVLNLLKNAEDVLVENSIINPEIKIKTYTNGNKAILEISDNGGGIDEKIIDKIFDPYFSTKLKKDGTGLGLYMSKIIIEEHCDGLLVCNNVKDGITFTMELNLA